MNGVPPCRTDDNSNKKDKLESPKLSGHEWANHLLDDWKYRHDAYARMTYRYIWSLVVLAVLPLIPLPAQLSPEFLQHVRQGPWYYTLVYWSFVALVFVSTSVQLWREFHYLEAVRQKLKDVRGEISLSVEQRLELRRKIHWVRVIYLLGFIIFFGFCIAIPRVIHPADSKQPEVVTRITNNEQFKINFKALPPECGLSSALSRGVTMKYDRNTDTWTATVGGDTTEWGFNSSLQRTKAAYTPQKHMLIINGMGFWFDDDRRVYRSCGNNEEEVGVIEFPNQNAQ